MGGEQAKAKVNLCLHITHKRLDGYHELNSLVVFPPIFDTLSAKPAKQTVLTIDGPFAAGLSRTENAVLQAAQAVGGTWSLHLTKNLPVASGIGGGSADAAAALRLLSRISGCPTPDGLPLGADVPVCLASETRQMRGIGEVLERVPTLPDFAMLMVNPGVSVSTQKIFSALENTENKGLDAIPKFHNRLELFDYLRYQRNDMQTAAVKLEPVIDDVLTQIKATPGCALARMSGSGATCFGLYSNLAEAQQAGVLIAQNYPAWWSKSAQL